MSQTPQRDYAARQVLSPLDRYLGDPDIFEIRINRFGEVVCDTTTGKKFFPDPAITEPMLHTLTNALLAFNGKGRKPINDVLLPDGTRGIICWPPATLPGTVLLSFRKHLPVTKTLAQLEQEKRFAGFSHKRQNQKGELFPFETEMLKLLDKGDLPAFFTLAVQNHQNIAVAGSTGSGKSTLTRSLLLEVPSHERLIILEDVHEITAPNAGEAGFLMYGQKGDVGRITVTEALRACTRLTPDRIIMAELRDEAAWDYLAGANTGHPGGIFSTHADSALTTSSRIADLVKQSEVGQGMEFETIRRKIEQTLDVVVFMKNWEVKEILYDPKGKRGITS
ncbi:ATPase, T2SS/T4P/T4SS family [Entomobacter blattae]|uniref:Type IV secretion system protein VirB11 n=1 Tax=Entomobacter blattae TaxID=2762277 RepID=A0A7H1NP58_9PROT|nr:ATPase, T2SS/T4P/T4SS family [Entomobacter blattae]QNT77568.1 Type IV secretion system protein VirB11 [Entomobacter blattae]